MEAALTRRDLLEDGTGIVYRVYQRGALYVSEQPTVAMFTGHLSGVACGISEMARDVRLTSLLHCAQSELCLFGFLTSSSTTRLYRGAATDDTELGDHDFCLSRSQYTDTDPTSRERAATVRIEPATFSPEVARSTDLANAPLQSQSRKF